MLHNKKVLNTVCSIDGVAKKEKEKRIVKTMPIILKSRLKITF